MASRARSLLILSRYVVAPNRRHATLLRCLDSRALYVRCYLTLSDVQGSRDPPLMGDTLGEFFLRQARTWSHNTALVVKHENLDQHGTRSRELVHHDGTSSTICSGDKSLRWTYQTLLAHAIALSHGLRDLGMVRGDRLAVCMPNNSAYAVIQWATALSGIILVTINPSYKAQEFVQALRQTGTKALFIVPWTKSSNFVELLRKTLPELRKQSSNGSDPNPFEHVIVVDNVSGRGRNDFPNFAEILSAIPGSIDFKSLLAFDRCNDLDISTAPVEKDDVVNLQFTR